jgi:hypothetical protein
MCAVIVTKGDPREFQQKPFKTRLFAVGPFFELFLKKRAQRDSAEKTSEIETQ